MIEHLEVGLLITLFSFLLGALSAFVIYRFGFQLALVDIPTERSSHSVPTLRGGGIGIWLTFLVASFLFSKSRFIPNPSSLTAFTIIASLVGLLGFVEDRFNISSKLRLLSQLILSGVSVFIFFLPHFSLFTFLFWIIFITGTANFYNFMDGINGIAGLTGVIAFGLMAFFSAFIVNEPYIIWLSVTLVAACLGFLPFNFPRAKVFMGDVGSIFLGFIFASFVVKLSTDIGMFLCLIMFLCTFFADAFVTIYYRWRRGENLMQAHRSHLYQYMSNELGLPHWIVTVIYGIVQLVFGLAAISVYDKGAVWQLVIIVTFGTMFLISYKIIKDINPQTQKGKVCFKGPR